MIRRVVALTSSVMFVAGTTPWPAGDHRIFAATMKSNGLKSRVNETATTLPDSTTQQLPTQIDFLRQHMRLSEVHYAVADNTMAAVLQDRSLYRQLAYKHWQARQKAAKEAAKKRQKSHTTTVVQRPLSSRSGGPLLKQTSYSTGFGMHVAKLALSLVGSPYRWGGESPSGFDCSGFLQYVFKRLGTVLPRTSFEQFSIGEHVGRNALQPGDLVFFTTDQAGASHVAIYVGNGLIVHALNPRCGVIVSRLSDSYYSSRYLGARRFGV